MLQVTSLLTSVQLRMLNFDVEYKLLFAPSRAFSYHAEFIFLCVYTMFIFVCVYAMFIFVCVCTVFISVSVYSMFIFLCVALI